MKTKLAAFPLVLMTFASAGEGAKSPVPPPRTFHVEEARILDQPYYGMLAPVYTTCGPIGRRSMPLVLNYAMPAEGAKGYSATGTPYLASTRDGTEYWDRHAYRSELPTHEELAALKSYDEFVALLGPPTESPGESRVDGAWGYDVVVWRLFTPVDDTNISVLHVTLHRRWDVNQAVPTYLIECFGVSGGGLEGGGATGPLFPGPGFPGPIGPIIETPVVSPS